VPLHTLRAEIAYGFARQYTTYADRREDLIFRGEVLTKQERSSARRWRLKRERDCSHPRKSNIGR